MKGTRYIRARLDSGAAVTESNESNNDYYSPITVTTSGKPDLHVKYLTAKVTGATVLYSATVCNNGGDTSQSSVLKLFYNKALNPTCTSSHDHSWTIIGGLKALACTTRTHTRPNVKPGFYIGWALSDGACTIVEGNEVNNEKSVGYTVSGLFDSGMAGDGGVYLDGAGPDMDGGTTDADMGGDAGAGDAGAVDADMAAADAGAVDADMAAADAGAVDADMATADAGVVDAGAVGDLLMTGEAGAAMEAGSPEAGSLEAGGPEAGVSPEAGAPDTGGGQDAITAGDSGGATDSGGAIDPGEDTGCDCQVTGEQPGLGWLLMLMSFALFLRRRRA